LKNTLLALTVLASISYTPGVYALDANGLDEAALYAITTDMDGETLAWTLVVPADRPKELVGTNPDIDRVELRPYKPGHNRQLWQIYPEDVVPAPSYKVFCKFGSNDDEPNAPVMVSRVNGDFAPDDDVEFHARYNAMAIGPNQASIEKFFLITRQASGGFVFQNFHGVEENLVENGNTNGWWEERAVDVYPTSDGAALRQRPLTSTGKQLWTLTVGAVDQAVSREDVNRAGVGGEGEGEGPSTSLLGCSEARTSTWMAFALLVAVKRRGRRSA
jgi:hypothetical protein